MARYLELATVLPEHGVTSILKHVLTRESLGPAAGHLSSVRSENCYQPGKRQRDEARGRIRTLRAMESHAAEGVDASEAAIDHRRQTDRRPTPWDDIRRRDYFAATNCPRTAPPGLFLLWTFT